MWDIECIKSNCNATCMLHLQILHLQAYFPTLCKTLLGSKRNVIMQYPLFMQIILSHLIFWPHLGCLQVPQARVHHVHVGPLGFLPQSLATLTLPHPQRMLHSSPSHGLYQFLELYKLWLLSNSWLMYPVIFEFSAWSHTDTFKSTFLLQHRVFPWALLFFLYFLFHGVIPSFLAFKQGTMLSLTFQVHSHLDSFLRSLLSFPGLPLP